MRPSVTCQRRSLRGLASNRPGGAVRRRCAHRTAPARRKGGPDGVTQKCQYALRALFELAKREGAGAARAADIAKSQAIPKRFLEVILHQLRQGGFVEATRGKDGGFYLARPARSIVVGEIIRFMDGPIRLVDCLQDKPSFPCPLLGNCVFYTLWEDARLALERVYDAKTLSDLMEMEQRLCLEGGMNYSI